MPSLTPIVEGSETLASLAEGTETLGTIAEGAETLTALSELTGADTPALPAFYPSLASFPSLLATFPSIGTPFIPGIGLNITGLAEDSLTLTALQEA